MFVTEPVITAALEPHARALWIVVIMQRAFRMELVTAFESIRQKFNLIASFVAAKIVNIGRLGELLIVTKHNFLKLNL